MNLFSIKTLVLGAATTAVLVFSSCHKHDEASAEIVIDTPTAAQIFENGETVTVAGSITGSAELHGYDIVIRNVDRDSIVYTFTNGDHANIYAFSKIWTNDVTDHSDMEATITVYVDHDGNSTSKTVEFHCHPM